MDAASQKVVKAPCSNCGGGHRNHLVHFAKDRPWEDEDHGESGTDSYQVVQCMGCDTLRFLQASTVNTWTRGGEETSDDTITVYPNQEQRPTRASRFIATLDPIPPKVLMIYNETIQAYNTEAPILTGAGLRAIVESLCNHEEIATGTLQKRINGLVEKGVLAKPQAEALHEQRFLGNAALHETEEPSRAELNDGLQIVETLLHTIFVLPQHAARMKAKREAKKAAKGDRGGPNLDAESE